ncbi:MAG: GGDEF domain-containing protein [Hespellia sp.]|nr:GGDEF domain-containing protein [Hespellia sp.]
MINLQSILIANCSAVLLMVIVLISQHRTTRYGLLDEKIYYTMVTLTILLCVAETAAFIIDGQMLPGYRVLSFFLNSLLYSVNITFSFVWTVYADYKLFEDTARIKKIYPFVAIPAVIVVAASIVNWFTPVFYRISAGNVYSRTSLYIIPYVITYCYLIYGVALIYLYRKKVGRYLFLPAVIFMLPVFIGSILQYLFYGVSLVWLGVAIGLVSLYVNVQNEASYIDALSGLFTGQYLSNYILIQSKKTTKKTLSGIMLDIDQFKSINDRFGHQVGDEAITFVGEILRSVALEDGIAARYAGDEFVIVHMAEDEKEVLQIIEYLRKATDRFNEKSGIISFRRDVRYSGFM